MANRVFSYVQNTAMMLLSPDPPIPQSGYHDFTHFTYEEMGRDVKPLTRLWGFGTRIQTQVGGFQVHAL